MIGKRNKRKLKAGDTSTLVSGNTGLKTDSDQGKQSKAGNVREREAKHKAGTRGLIGEAN